MSIKNVKIYFVLGIAMIAMFTFCISKSYEDYSTISASTGSISNTKIGWGIKRADNNQQPDVGSQNKKLLDEYNGIYLGNQDKRYIYLTFDEGYEAGYTSKILDVLKENNVKATFFITGPYLNQETQLVKRMIDEGHIVGNHTVNHPSMPSVTDDEKLKVEVTALHKALYEKTGYEMQYIRPPMGEFSQRTLEICKNLGYTNVMWSFAYDDWDINKQKGTEYAKEKILKNVHNGEVMLLHAVSKDNCEVLDYCIKQIKEMGYEFKSLDEFER